MSKEVQDTNLDPIPAPLPYKRKTMMMMMLMMVILDYFSYCGQHLRCMHGAMALPSVAHLSPPLQQGKNYY